MTELMLSDNPAGSEAPPLAKPVKNQCPCGCGKRVTNWTQACYPVPPWDTPGLPPRRMEDRCARHDHCAYRDDDPNRCPVCHTIGHSHCEQAILKYA